jgi:hypothetical protein
VRRIREQLDILSPTLQELFLLNPAAFVQSSELPPEIRSLIENAQLTNTEVSVNGQFHLSSHLNLSANAGYLRNAQTMNANSSTRLFGYSMSYQLSPSVQLLSSVSNVLLFNSQKRNFERTTVMTVGFNKNFSGVPRWLVPFHSQHGVIRGRVFRDLNLNGVFNPGEPGVPDVAVEIEGEHKTVVTDADGRFEFFGMNPGNHNVRLQLSSLRENARLTGPAQTQADLFAGKTSEVYFGVVNFSRLMGNVFNDYLLDGQRQPNASGLRKVSLKLTGNSGVRTLTTDGAGDYALNDITPGEYELSVDPATLPENFVALREPIHLHVAPVSSVVMDVPIRALRSISGHVYYRRNGQSPGEDALEPLEGVSLQIGKTAVTTDADGSFIARDLPAGPLMLSTLPARQLPQDLAAPEGKITLSPEPMQVENVRIVISNAALLQYLLPYRDISTTSK